MGLAIVLFSLLFILYCSDISADGVAVNGNDSDMEAQELKFKPPYIHISKGHKLFTWYGWKPEGWGWPAHTHSGKI